MIRHTMNSHSTYKSTIALNCDDDFSSRSKIEYVHHSVVVHDDPLTISSTGHDTCSFVTIFPLQRQLSDLTIDQDLLCEDVVAANKYWDNETHRKEDTKIIRNTGRCKSMSPRAAVSATTFNVPTSVQIIDTFRCSSKLDLIPKQPTRTGSVDNNHNKLTKIL